ncbi:hypothetical protein ScPMuIL_017147 [Solemya velum]
MDQLTARENLFQLWMIYLAKKDVENLKKFVKFFIDTYKSFIDHEFAHLNEGPMSGEFGSHLSDCFQKTGLPTEIQLQLLHLFGAIISGVQINALKAITPATLDVLLQVLSTNQIPGPTNEQRSELTALKDLVLKCIVRLVHVIHVGSPDQRQVEVSQVMEGYMQVLHHTITHSDRKLHKKEICRNNYNTINEMLACQDKKALQVIMVSGGTFDAFITLLQRTTLTGPEAQKLAMSVIKVLKTVLSGSSNAKERFGLRVGYSRFLEALKSLGQPSIDLLGAVLNLVVECEFVEKKCHAVCNTEATNMLLYWLPDIQSHDLQIWLSENLRFLCTCCHNNKMNCCQYGMIKAVLTVLGRQKQINLRAVGHLIGLMESLGTQSISATELKQLICVFKLDEENKPNPYTTRLMHAISTMARREGKEGALHFFNIHKPSEGIVLPGIRKWPGPAFSFHTWLCLDTHIDVGSQLYRRQLYSFCSSLGCGFEAFFTPECDLVLAVYNRREYCTVSVSQSPLSDAQWHCIDIVHTSSRRPFTNSQINVYIDGRLKLNAQLKFPNMAEPFASCRIGSSGYKPELSAYSDGMVPSYMDQKKSSPLKFLFSVPIHGHLGSVCIFHDALYPGQVKALYTAGPNHLNLFHGDEFAELSDLPGKLEVYYNAKACKDGFCLDLSPNQNHGQLSGQKYVTWDVKDVVNCIGGIQTFFQILEYVNKSPLSDAQICPLSPISPSKSKLVEEWVIIQSSSYADANLEQNQVSGFLTLLKNMMQAKVVNQDMFIRTNCAASIGALLQKVNPKLIDVNVLMAVQLMVDSVVHVNRTMLNHLYQYILFDFRVWSKSDFPCQDRAHTTYYSCSLQNNLSADDAKPIRMSLFGLIKYYVIKDITFQEVSQILNFLIVLTEEEVVLECLDMLISLLQVENRKKQDQLYLLLFENDMAEMFYGLLTRSQHSAEYYEKVVKMLHILLKTDKVYEKSKIRLRLLDCGYLGLVEMIKGCPVTPQMIKMLLEQVSLSDSAHSYNAVLAVLQLIEKESLEVKLEASRQILAILVTKPNAARHFSKQLGWQEVLTKLFIGRPITGNANTETYVPHNPVAVVTEVDEGGDKLTENVPQVVQGSHGLSSHESPSKPSSLQIDYSQGDAPVTLTPKSPATPMYLAAQMFDDPNGSEDERSRSMSRSSSASAEDLSAIGQRAQELSFSPSSLDNVGGAVNSLLLMEPRRDSVLQNENFQKALDNLGILKTYVEEDSEITEELCQTLLIIVLTIMWKGIEGSEKTAWLERGQVFAWFDQIAENYELIRMSRELKRRLIEMLLHSCTADLREAASATIVHTENAYELVKIVRDFVVDDSSHNEDKYSERLIEDVMSLLDMLSVWDVERGTGWKDMVHLGLSILLAFARHSNLELCAVTTARLHTLVQTKLISSSAEASFLIGSLNKILIQAIENKLDSYSFLIPVMKALIEKAYALMNMDYGLPNLPTTTRSPTFFEDFQHYCRSEEWTNFIDNIINPQMYHFVDSVFKDQQQQTKDFWSKCHESIMINLHNRNREKGESKLKFQGQVMEIFKKKVEKEQRRFQNITTQLRNQYLSTLRQWRGMKRFFTGERGAWSERTTVAQHWKLSNQENFSRMKVKLTQNNAFDSHKEASSQRDNLGLVGERDADRIPPLAVAKEALVSKEDIADDILGDEDWNVISTSSSIADEYSGKEKFVLSEDCELITLVEVIKGRLEVTTTHVYFFDCSSNKEEGGEDFKWALSQLREIHFRRYNLRRSALEMFLVDQTNYFLNFQKKIRNKVYSRILSLRPANLIYYGTRSPAELLKASGLTQKWVQREISNFDYLMQLNTIAGRTYNDLSQYPVFPWILVDYESEVLDLENPAVYRDLSKPVGVINPKNEEQVREKFDTFEDPSGVVEKFHYGTHYSSGAGVMHYMVRMEPFTTLHIQLQSGRFDVADRQFHSISGTWTTLMENPNDVKELIPEFFYMPEFLVNMNDFDLGKLQLSKKQVTDVVLPRWASSPEDFINKHKQALESNYVSENLHNWIDLIFGYKQKGPAAEEALNVFFYCTYEGAVDLDAIKDDNERKVLEGMINNFGQTPCQLLKEPHPKRMSFQEVVLKSARHDKPFNLFHFLNQLKVYFVEISMETDPLTYVTVARNQARSIISSGMPDTMVSIFYSGIIGTHGWLPYDKAISSYFTFEKDPSMHNAKTRKKIAGSFMPGLDISVKLFVVSHDSKLLFSGGHWDNSLQIYHIGKGRRIGHIVRHIDVVTCLALDYCGSHLISGSRDTTCIVWHIQQQGGMTPNVSIKPLQTLYGHDAEVTAVCISTELDMAVSSSQDGSVIVHTVRRGIYMRTLRPDCEPGYFLQIPLLALGEMGQIVMHCHEVLQLENKERFTIHQYSVNGKHLWMEQLQWGLGHMVAAGDQLVTGDVAGELTIMNMFGLKVVNCLPLHVPIQCLALTPGNTHILAGLRDGKLIIVGIKNRSEIR